VVLDVIVTDGNQGDSSSLGIAINNIHLLRELSTVTNSSTETASVTRDVASLRIRDSDDSLAPVVSSYHTLELALQPLSTSSDNQFQLEAENSMPQEIRLRQLHLKVNALFGRIQQSEQQTQQTQQQMNELLGREQQTDQQMKEVLGKVQQTDQSMQEVLGREQQTDQQMKEILGKMQEIDRQLEEAQCTQLQMQQLQNTQQQQQQMNDKIETALRTLQQLDQKTQVSQQHTHDKQDQLQQQLNEALEWIQQMDEQIQDMERSLSTQRRQKTLQAFHYFAFVQSRAQALLATSYKGLSIPRLFIVLLEPTDAIDGQGRSCLLQFRLRFLCECDAHKMTKNANGLHKVHLVDHPGYELVNLDEFIDKYGSYLLTILYTVKYGTKAGGLAVLPLLGLKDATEDEEDEVHIQSIKKNFGGFVEDTITHLEGVINMTDKRPKTSAHQGLDLLELEQLTSYLKVRDGERSIGYLRPVTTQEEYCAWVCFDHILEYYGPAFQRMKYTLSTSGAVLDSYCQLKFTSATTTKQLYDAISDARFVKSIGYWEPLTYLDLEVSTHSSTMKPVPDIDSALKSLQKPMQDVHRPAANGINGNKSIFDLGILTLDFDRFSMQADGFAEGVIGTVFFEVPQLSGLTPNDLEFIRQCQPIYLDILCASEETDEARLVDILQHSKNLSQLCIGCSSERSFKLINSILSTREKTLQSRGLSALRYLEVAQEGLAPPTIVPEPCSCDQYTESIIASFSEDSCLLDMHVNLSSDQLDSDDTAVCDFFRRYGWAIKTLGVPYLFGDHHAKQLDESTQEHGSMIEHLDITPIWLTETGLNAIDRVVKRSQNFVSMRLTLSKLEENDQMEKALVVLKRYKDRLKSLRLTGDATGWLIRVAEAFPAKEDFPVLESLCGEYGVPWKANNPGFVAWIKGVPQPSRAFCSASVGKVGDKGLLHHWAYNC